MSEHVKTGLRRLLPWLLLSVLVIMLDQWSKLAVEQHFVLYETKPVLPFFNLVLAYNTGAAFSFLHDAGGWQRWLFAGIAMAVSAFILSWLWQLPASGKRWLHCALALVLGGALGNLYDRMAYGHVVDFIQVHWQWQWFFPAFNIADSAISVGAAMLIIDTLFLSRNDPVETLK